MIAGLKPYSAMKDAGVPWLGEVPEHWEIERLKARAANIIEQTDERPSGGLYVALEHVESWTGRLRDAGSETSFESQVKRFRPDDVLFGKLRPYLAKVARPTREGVCVGEFFVLRSTANGVGADYLAQLLRSKSIIDAIDASTFGAKMPRADWHFVGNLALPFPPLSEQAAIVRFLDHADRRIRRYIRAKQKLIKLLEEQKQAIIHRAVFRGLDPNVRLKPSGVEWLGEVPAHWNSLRTRYLFCEVDDRSVAGVETHLSMSQKLGLVPSSMVEQQTLVSESYTGGKLCEPGDLVLNRLKAHLGVFALANQSGVISPDYSVFRRIRPLSMRYFEYVLRSPACRRELRIRAKGIVQGFWRLYTDDFYDIRVPVPPVNEQDRIVVTIQNELRTADTAIERLERELFLLREYRTRLIADVVTGKLDVREAAANLRYESGEPEALDDTDTLAEGDEPADGDLDAAREEAEA